MPKEGDLLRTAIRDMPNRTELLTRLAHEAIAKPDAKKIAVLMTLLTALLALEKNDDEMEEAMGEAEQFMEIVLTRVEKGEPMLEPDDFD